jgi:hypothetical protein
MPNLVRKVLTPFRLAWDLVEGLDCIELIVLALVPLVRFLPWAALGLVPITLIGLVYVVLKSKQTQSTAPAGYGNNTGGTEK